MGIERGRIKEERVDVERHCFGGRDIATGPTGLALILVTVLDPSIETDSPKHVVGKRSSVKLHDRWQGGHDRVDDRCEQIVERSITAAGGRAGEGGYRSGAASRECNGWTTGSSWFSQALQRFCDGKVGSPTFRPARRATTGPSNRSTTHFARSASTATIGTVCSSRRVMGDFKHEHNRHRHPAMAT